MTQVSGVHRRATAEHDQPPAYEAGTGGPAPERRKSGRLRAMAAQGGRWALTPDGRNVLLLAAVPLVVFVVPALLGHPAIAGDNNIQNFPLRVLSGRIIRQGHLPLWNPYIWSGNPLLGGLNAGALYPTTLVFAVLPPVAAWVVNLLVVYWAGGLGMYALLRQYRLAPLATLLGAATYAYTGAMAGQLVHLPIVQGMSWMPILVLALLRLAWAVLGTGPTPAAAAQGVAAQQPRGRPWPWVVLLAVTLGLVLLCGEPRGMAEAEVVSVVVFAWLLLRPYRSAAVRVRLPARLRYLGFTVLAAVWGAALGAVQLLPGLHFISTSQRATESFSFFGSGSLHPQWSVLMLVPDVFGGDGLLHQPTFFNSYNLPEVTGYVGLLPLVAAFGLLTVSFGRHRARRSGDWGLWVLLAVLGVLMAFGEYTWLGGVFGHIPFFDRLRLQSRNIAIADLGLSALLAFWVDRLLGEGTPAESAGWRKWVAAAPALAAAAVCVVVLVIPYRFEFAFGASKYGATLGVLLRPWVVMQLVLALAVAVVVVGWRHMGPVMRRRLLCAVLACDVLLFTVSVSTGLSNGNVIVQPGPEPASSVIGTTGRFAIYDTTALNIDDLSYIGQPDLNVFTGLLSVQGYGSIVDNTYGTATGTHDLDTLDPCALANGTFTQLRLASLLTLPQFLAPRVAQGAGSSAAASQPAPPACPGAPLPGTATSRTWYLGQALTVQSVTLVRKQGVSASSVAAAAAQLRVGLLGATGGVQWPRETVKALPQGWEVSFPLPAPATGIVVDGPVRSISDDSTVSALLGSHYRLDGVLQDALGQPAWRFAGLWRQYSTFRHPVLPSPVWLEHPVSGASVSQVSTTDWGSEVDRLRTPKPVTVVRSETFQEGWHVEAKSAAGRTLDLPVQRVGLVQAVDVPAGSWTLTFLYRPTGLNAGLAASGAGLVLLAVAGGVAVRARRRRLRVEAQHR